MRWDRAQAIFTSLKAALGYAVAWRCRLRETVPSVWSTIVPGPHPRLLPALQPWWQHLHVPAVLQP